MIHPPVHFIWTIENFSRLNTKLYSDIFYVGGYKWRVLLYPKGNNVEHLSMYLAVADSAVLPFGWRRYAKFSLAVISKISSFTVRKVTEHQFNAQEDDWGFTSFMCLGELHDPGRHYLVNDRCIVEADVAFNGISEQCYYPDTPSFQESVHNPQPSTLVGEETLDTTQVAPQQNASSHRDNTVCSPTEQSPMMPDVLSSRSLISGSAAPAITQPTPARSGNEKALPPPRLQLMVVFSTSSTSLMPFLRILMCFLPKLLSLKSRRPAQPKRNEKRPLKSSIRL